MKEIISLFIGQAGVQLGNSIWELLSAEHGINPLGIMKEEALNIECVETFFSLSDAGQYVARALLIDLEPTVIDEIKSGAFGTLFHPDRLIRGPEDAASNFARGFFTVGKLLLGAINNESRRMLESNDCTQGILLFRSLGGGTGAGLTSAIFDGLAEFPKITKIEIPIYPSPTLATAMVEPYNCLLGEHFCMEDIDVGLLLDNEALYDICLRYLSVDSPTFSTINRIVAQLCSSITASVRFESALKCDITVLQTNLVPYPRIHFPLANFAPILSQAKSEHEELTVMDLTRYVFEKENQMMKVDHSFGKFMSCSLLYRGNISPYHVYEALVQIKNDKNIEFVDWCPTGFKVGINICPPTIIPASKLAHSSKNVTMLTNTSAIGQAWQRLTHKFYLLYSKRSFVHWFIGEGMEECEFTESLYNISALVKDYEEAAKDTKSNIASLTNDNAYVIQEDEFNDEKTENDYNKSNVDNMVKNNNERINDEERNEDTNKYSAIESEIEINENNEDIVTFKYKLSESNKQIKEGNDSEEINFSGPIVDINGLNLSSSGSTWPLSVTCEK